MTTSRDVLDAMHPESRQIHAGRVADLGHAEPTALPIHLATAYTYPTTSELDAVFADSSEGYVYSRIGNPTVRALEAAIAAIEGFEDGVAYGSGMAAIHGIVTTLAKSGDTIVASRDVYGATSAILSGHLADLGINTVFADATDTARFSAVIAESQPVLVLVEAISNPLIRVVDIRAIAEASRTADALLVLDNTFATPVVIRGGDLGADAVVYSGTKHLGGHGDTTSGIIATSGEMATTLRAKRTLVGGVASPFDAWLVLRGIRTLDLRVRRQCANAERLATHLASHPQVKTVYYPGCNGPIPPGQFQDGLKGTMLAFEIQEGDRDTAFRLQDSLKMILPATTLGDVHTMVLHPATSSHRTISQEQRDAIGIQDSLVRVSLGIEHIDDIIADLDQAISSAVAS
ncbi:MAG TPA: PLP-dependent aspartate aminotransferase family protein [Thermomicrobiales bacterium]|nr:PLP-dependent aspartate aminotransferase family protein [Thermomicrobiales bacterium]